MKGVFKILGMFGWLAAMCARTGEAAQVTRINFDEEVIYLSGAPSPTLRLGDSVCLFLENRRLGCGMLRELQANSIAIKMTEGAQYMVIGESVSVRRPERRAPPVKKAQRATASQIQATVPSTPKSNKSIEMGLGFVTGFIYYYPMAHFSIALSQKLTLGLRPIYAQYGARTLNVQVLGGYSALTYYFENLYDGFFLEAGLGILKIDLHSSTTQASASPWAPFLGAGWRAPITDGSKINIGVMAGAQYLSYPDLPFETTFRDLLPMLSIFGTYSF